MTLTRLLLFLAFVGLMALASGAAETTTFLTWGPAAPFPGEGRHHPIAFANETHGFLLTGSTASQPYTTDFYLYTEETDEWTDLSSSAAAFPGAPRSFGYGLVLNQAGSTKAYLGFGAGPDNVRWNDFWEFDMASLTWTQLADFPGLGRRHPAMNAVYSASNDGWEIHVGLGDGVVGNLNDWWSYTISSNTWRQLTDFPGSTRHHPFYFGINGSSYAGLGHSDRSIERDWYRYEESGEWVRELDFQSYNEEGVLVTTEARVAGTEFAIELPLIGTSSSDSSMLSGSLGFVLSGDGDDHSTMEMGEFHVFYPGQDLGYWRELPPHPGLSRWAPGSFVMRGSARVYFTGGFDRSTGILYNDLWRIDLSPLFSQEVDAATPEASPGEVVTPDNVDLILPESENENSDGSGASVLAVSGIFLACMITTALVSELLY